jgi:hypothetical protein
MIPPGGVGPDGEYRDPWGGAYVISHGHEPERTLPGQPVCPGQLFHKLDGHEGLLNGLVQSPIHVPPTGQYELAGQYMIWSRGPDGQADPAT